jgi:hypothetical protein
MEQWIWLVALGLGLLVLILALAWLASRVVVLARKLKPFADHLARFKKDAEQYPEAVKFFSELAQPEETAASKPRKSKR